MGRLNYTNRKIEGLKLGQVVSKDLVKRIPPHTGSKAAFRDPSLDLDVSNKALTDEGFFEIASALVEALSYEGVQGRCLRLEDLCLKENQLSVSSLQALTPIIRQTSFDLRDLDLSNNMIAIETRDDAAIWETFLTSFGQSCSLRRIDVGGNPLGPRGFEVLLRVYAKEKPIDLSLSHRIEEEHVEVQNPSEDCTSLMLRKMSIVTGLEEHGTTNSDELSTPKRKGSCHGYKSPEKTGITDTQASPLPIYATTRGLRSVPYLILCDTAMNETCALHLSYIIEGHHPPEQLLTRVPSAKAGLPAQQIMTYDESHCHGIVYYANPQIGNAGTKALELAEKRRNHLRCEVNQVDSEPPTTHAGSSKPSRIVSGVNLKSTVVTRAKRRASAPIDDLDHTAEGADLDRARSRIQGNTLQEAGPSSNDLWRTALRLLALARQIQRRREDDLLRRPVPASAAAAAKVKAPIIKTLTIPGVSKPKTLKPLTPLTVEKDSNRPMNHWNTMFGKSRNEIPPTPNVIPPTPLVPSTVMETSMDATEKKVSLCSGKVYRSKLPCGFSECAWAKILGRVAGGEGILSDDQQLSVLRYAIDRSTLGKEREALGLTFAIQVWRVLEATGCLGYEMDI